MPFFDGTGPRGQGPVTGRGMGPCGGAFGFGRRGYGGFGRGFGGGFGRGFGFFGRRALTSKEEKELLQSYKKDLEAELSSVDKDLQDLE